MVEKISICKIFILTWGVKTDMLQRVNRAVNGIK